jgi:hypothetical protein
MLKLKLSLLDLNGDPTPEQLQTLAHPLLKTPYGQYLTNLLID